MASSCGNSHTLLDMGKKDVQLKLKEFREGTSRIADIEWQASPVNGVRLASIRYPLPKKLTDQEYIKIPGSGVYGMRS